MTGNLYFVFLLLGGGISLYTAFVNGKKYAGEIGVLRAWGVPSYKITLFFSLENLYVIIVAVLISILLAYPFFMGFFIGLYHYCNLTGIFTHLLLFPLLFALLISVPSSLYFYYIIKRKNVLIHLRNM